MFGKNKDIYPDECTEIWRKYERGIDYHRQIRLLDRTDKNHRFYLGDQWYGANTGGETLPIFNFIKPIVKYKVATVSQNTMTANYSPIEHNSDQMAACDLLNLNFARCWEKGKMDTLSWKIIKDAAIAGDSYIYFGEGGDIAAGQMVDNVNIFFADEQNAGIQEQKYIIIKERLFVSDVKRMAKSNGISDDDISLILPDDKSDEELGDKKEVNYDREDGKCTSLLYMEKDESGFVHIARSVKNIVYQPDKVLRAELSPLEQTESEDIYSPLGLKSYPIISFVWEDKKGSVRGSGEVEYLIPNQLEVNKTLARRSIAVKQGAYPKLAYAEGMVKNPESLDKIGGTIAIQNTNAQGINNIVSYLSPINTSPDAKNLSDELIYQSRELAGAGDAATGSIDPTKASGTAIIAVRDQTALPLNEQVARYQQMVEDLAYLWYDLMVSYNPNGIVIETEDDNGEIVKAVIPPEVLETMKVNVRVDVSKANPYSKYAREQSLQNLFGMQAISFEEYVNALDDDAAMPKGKLQDILDKRAEEQRKQEELAAAMAAMQQEIQQKNQEIGKLGESLNTSTNILNQLTNGGGNNALQGL